MIERHDATGFWLAQLPVPDPEPRLEAHRTADVVIAGGGYTGMWAAWWLQQMEPETDVVLLEAGVCGHGPSGRNGGFCEGFWNHLPALRVQFGDEAALRLARAADESVGRIGQFCEDEPVDAHFNRAGYIQVSTAPTWDGDWDSAVDACGELGAPEAVRALSASEVAARCASPRFRAGAIYPGYASVEPARLALGLRDRLLDAGVAIHENSPVRSVNAEPGGDVVVATPSGSVRARRAILAIGGALVAAKPWRRRLTVTTSHVVATEPVPDLLEEIGWTGGECITDSRAMVHYMRTTRDGRIVFGWGGGPVVPGARLRGPQEVDAELVAKVAEHLVSFFPGLEGRRIVHAWGGPIDVSPAHVPQITMAGEGRVAAAFGYTGNGVGPSCLLGQTQASIALDRADAYTRLPIVEPPAAKVPPEPFRYLGGLAVRRALLGVEAAAEEERDPGRMVRWVAGLPARLGVRIGR